MDSYLNENSNSKKEYSLEDAFHIIQSIINSEKDKYEKIINSMNQKMSELKVKLKQLQEENVKYKNKIFQLQNQFFSLSKTLYQLNEAPDKSLSFDINNKKEYHTLDDLNQNKEMINQIQNDNSQIDNNKDDNELNNNDNYMDNEINHFYKTDLYFDHFKNSFNQRLFNKKLIKKINSFNQKNNNIGSKSFNNQTQAPIKIVRRNKDKEDFLQNNFKNNLNDNYFKEQNKTFNSDRKMYDNYGLQNFTNKKENTQKEKFNIIEKRIKNMKNGLSIYNIDKTKFNNDINDYSRTKYENYSLNNKRIIYKFDK